MRKLAILYLLFWWLPLISPSFAQEAGKGDVTPVLLPGLGNHHHAISTSNSEAQKYFDQGLMLVFSFNRAEAVRSFRRAAQLDPAAAMPYWGMALAYGRHMNMDADMDVQDTKAYTAIQQALALSGNASGEEQLYIHALAQRCSKDEKADGHMLDENYAAAMTTLASHYPDDLDAWAFSLEARMMSHRYEWFHGNMAQDDTNEIIQEIEGLLRRDPNHPLANHLHIHILDTGHPELALGSAYRLGQVAPGLGHLVHMPSHIYFNLGDYEMTARVNAQAAAAERTYMKLASPGYNVYTLTYYVHDLHFVSRARAEQGLFEEAKSYADQVADYARPEQDQWPMISDYYLPVPLLALLRFQRWDEFASAAGTASQSENRGWFLALWARAGLCSEGTEAEGTGGESGAGKLASEHFWRCDVDAEYGASNAQPRVPGIGCAVGGRSQGCDRSVEESSQGSGCFGL